MILYDAEFAERIYAEKGHSGTEFRTSPSILEPVMALRKLLLILRSYISFAWLKMY